MGSDIRTFGFSNATITYTYDEYLCISGYKKDDCTGRPLRDWVITVNNSTDTYGVRYNGTFGAFAARASYAYQSDAGDSSLNYDGL